MSWVVVKTDLNSLKSHVVWYVGYLEVPNTIRSIRAETQTAGQAAT